MKRRFKFDDYEVNIIIKALIELRNQLIAEGRYTDAVDELLIKALSQKNFFKKCNLFFIKLKFVFLEKCNLFLM